MSDATENAEYLERALGLLAAVAAEAEALNAHVAVHGGGTCNGIRTRVQNIHGLAVTPEVEEWPEPSGRGSVPARAAVSGPT